MRGRRAGFTCRPLLYPVLALLLGAPANALPEPRFLRLTHDQGLSDNTVEAIVSDFRGFMWFGTTDGLNRYDGYTFHVYRNDPQDPGSLSDNYVTALLEDHDKTLWIGTLGGLNRYDRQTDTFVSYENDAADPASLSNDIVHALHEGHDGTLWVGTYWGVNRFEPGSSSFTRFLTSPGGDQPPNVRALFEDRRGTLWIGTEGDGLHALDPRTGEITSYRPDPQDPAGFGASEVWDVTEDREGLLWLATHEGLFRFDRGTDAFERFTHDPEDPTSLANDHVEVVFEDREGHLWIGTDGGGLGLFDRERETFTHTRHDDAVDSTLGSDVVRTIFEDPLGDLWIGTFTGGAAFHNKDAAVFSHERHRAGDPRSLSHNAVLSFFEDTDGTLWIGTEGGLNHLDRATGKYRSYRFDESDPGSLSANAVLSIHRDRQGTLWVGTYFGGLNRFVPETGTFVHYMPDPADPLSLAAPHVWSIYEDSMGVLWLATRGGVHRMERDTGSFVHYPHDPDDPAHNLVWCIREDRAGRLWLASHGGLNLYDRAGDRFKTYRHRPDDPSGPGTDRILTILEDRRGMLWLGTEGGGLNRFDPEEETFTVWRTADGLASDTVFCVLEDRRGRLWMSTPEGLSRFEPPAGTADGTPGGTFTHYDKSDGLLAAPFSRNSCLESRDGDLYFGGINGYTSFDPEEVRDNVLQPPVVLTDFQVFNQPVMIGGPQSPLDRHVTEAERVRVRHDQSVLTFAYAALSFRSPEKNRYAYRLEGFDDDWRDVGTERRATYTNLDPGTYVFRVKASNNSGLWNETGTSIEVVVTPPLWATWWFRAGSAFLAVALLITFYQVRTHGIRTHNQELQAEIAERRKLEVERERLIREMEEKNATLEAQNAELERFTYTLSHDLTSPLVTIKGFLGRLRLDVQARDFERVDTDLEHIGKAADTMRRLLRDLLELSRIGRLAYEPEDVPLDDLVREAAAAVDGLVRERGAVLVFAPGLPTVYADRARLFEVFQIVLENAVRYLGDQRAPRIEVGARARDDEVECWVRDNGRGIEPRYHEKVFGLFERLADDVEGTGIGLALVKRIVEAHGGRIWVESEGGGRGSTFRFTFPRWASGILGGRE